MEVEKEFTPALDKVVSLSLDQVDSNPDGLIELRGEGRYFGLQDDSTNSGSGPLCANCHQPGHRRAQCKTVMCHACGAVGDHYTERCPKSMVCYNCGERGHFGNTCKQRMRRLYCQICESSRHMDNRCPSIWRSYLTKNDGKSGLPNNMYCYNCAEKGHYGDDCPKQRGSRMPNVDGSAFSGHNLPQSLRDTYHQVQKKRKREGDDKDRDKKKSLLNRVKSVFQKDKSDKYGNDSNSNNYNNNNNNRQVHKSQSLPVIRKSGFISKDYGRGQQSYNNNSNNGSQKPYKGGKFQGNKSKNNDFPRPSRSGTIKR